MLRHLAVLAICFGPLAGPARADVFTFTNAKGERVQVEGRLLGTGQGVHAVELADGQLLVLPQEAVTGHEETDGPEPLDEKEVQAKLEEFFVKDRFLCEIDKPYVVGLVLAAADDDERRAIRRRTVLKKVARLFSSVQTSFLSFIRSTRVHAQALDYPLIVLVFEDGRNFEEYAKLLARDPDYDARQTAALYDELSNQLVLRQSELDDYAVLIHEGIHQQMYNRRIVQRLAPVPDWLGEGMATGFEGNGKRLRVDPKVPNAKYARRSARGRAIDFAEIVQHDRAFHGGGRVAFEAYGHAWSLHWLLVNEYRPQYARYVRKLSKKKSLAKESAEDRLKEFEATIGEPVEKLQKEFLTKIRVSLRRRRRSSALPASGFDSIAGRRTPSSNRLHASPSNGSGDQPGDRASHRSPPLPIRGRSLEGDWRDPSQPWEVRLRARAPLH